ncbi:MAG: hypothetical protein ACK52I_30230 [Pseudomonadota bacterium]
MIKIQYSFIKIITTCIVIVLCRRSEVFCQVNLCINGDFYEEFEQDKEEIRHVAFSYAGHSTFIDGEFQKITLYKSDSLLVFDSYLTIAPELAVVLQSNFDNFSIYENKYVLIRRLEIDAKSLYLHSEFRFDPRSYKPNRLWRSIKKWYRSISRLFNYPGYEINDSVVLESRKMYLMAYLLMNTHKGSDFLSNLFHKHSFLQILGPEYGEEGMAYLSALQEFNLMPIGEGYAGDQFPCSAD